MLSVYEDAVGLAGEATALETGLFFFFWMRTRENRLNDFQH